jgi:alpha-tubulin suppressor-like RCC1 family protein
VLVGGVAAAGCRSYAVTETGEVWAWGIDRNGAPPIGYDDDINCPLPKPIESLRGAKVDAVAAGYEHTLAVADDGGVYAWGTRRAAGSGALALRPSMMASECTPQRIPALRVGCVCVLSVLMLMR